ncbi:hypothetical protein [Nostoc linckia]|nr:hypothetical protein [Nostoc linckia]
MPNLVETLQCNVSTLGICIALIWENINNHWQDAIAMTAIVSINA